MPFLASAARLVTGVVRRLTGVGLARTAAALSFTTILGFVPLMTVAVVYVARYPLFERWMQSLERFLVRHLLPGAGASIRPYLEEFTRRAAELQGLGIVFVVATAITLVMTIEREINAIWGIERTASPLRRLVVGAWARCSARCRSAPRSGRPTGCSSSPSRPLPTWSPLCR